MDFLESFLTDSERASLQRFADDEIMHTAVQKVILAGIYYNGTLEAGKKPDPLRNFALTGLFNQEYTDEVLGQKTRARVEAIRTLELAYQELLGFKTAQQASKEKQVKHV